MKKKFVSYLVLAGAVFGLAMVGSCKDYEYDVLQEQINGLNANSTGADGTLSNRIAALETEIAKKLNNPSTSSDLSDSLSSIYTLLEELTNMPAGSSVADLKTALNTINEKLAGASSIADVEDDIEDLKLLWSDSLRTAYKNAYIAKNLAEKDSAKIDTIFDKLADIIAAQDTLVGRVELSDSIKELEERYQTADLILALAIASVYEEVEQLSDSLSKLYLTEKKRITSLYVQGTMNPIFGTIAYPGSRLNVLAAYIGHAAQDTKFPLTVEDEQTGAIISDSMLLQKSEKIAFKNNNYKNMKTVQIPAGYFSEETEDNAGRIFITVNPNEVELDDTYSFKFVTSDGKVTPATTIGKFVPSTEKLTFGWTRADVSSTGFYEAPVKISYEGSEKLTPEWPVSNSELLGIAKKIINKNGINLGGIAEAIFTLAQAKFNANAVRVEWSDSLGDHSVTSPYDVAVTAIQPLSYSVMSELRSVSTDFRIPTISPLSEISITTPSITVDLSDISFSVDGVASNISFADVVLDKTGSVWVEVDVPTDIDATGKKTYNVDNLGQVLQDVEDAFNGKLVTWGDNVNDEVESVVAQLKEKVNYLIQTQLAGKLDTSINDMLKEVESAINKSLSGYNNYIGQMNDMLKMVNNLSDKLNPILSLDGSAFLAPWIMYEGADGQLHPMSNDKNNPSVFKMGKVNKNGGIVLYLTSFNNDMLTPAYKKFIAATKYVKPNGSFETTGTTIKAINESYPEYYNTVLDGARYAVPFVPTKAGTYTLYYTALDYQGYVAAERFYVTVEE